MTTRLRGCIGLAQVLLLLPAVRPVQAQSFDPKVAMFPQCCFACGPLDDKVILSLTVNQRPGGYTVPFGDASRTFCFEYLYTLTVDDGLCPPDDEVGGVTFGDCVRPFAACAPVVQADPKAQGNGIAKWTKPVFTAGMKGVPFAGAKGDGIRMKTSVLFRFYSDSRPAPGTVRLSGYEFGTRTGYHCGPMVLEVPYTVPCGTVCDQGPPPPPPVAGGDNCRHFFTQAQVYPATRLALPGYPGPGLWRGGEPVPFETLAPPIVPTVPGVLSLDTRLTDHKLNVASFLSPLCCAPPLTPSVEFVRLTKRIPGSNKVPAAFPPQIYVQNGRSEIRTWWPLMYTQPGTTFTLEIGGTCGTGPYRDTWVWTVVANPDTFRLLLTYFHTAEIGQTEIPCMVDEPLYRQLTLQADAIKTTLTNYRNTPSSANRVAAQDAIIQTEALIMGFSVLLERVDRILPMGSQPPPNCYPTAPIIDTLENPCESKLIVDLEAIARQSGLSE